MTERSAPPGAQPGPREDPARRFAEGVDRGDLEGGAPWDQYLDDPDERRLGICCSGGGIRSASYALGALQVLRRERVLQSAAHLASVSGGGYMAAAHAVLVSESLRAGPDGDADDEEIARRERELFADLAPWAAGSPEEQHLRNQTTYLSPGITGKAWLALNAIYGLCRHLVPFAAWIVLSATVVGLALSGWIRPALQRSRAGVGFGVPLLALAGLAALIGAVLLWRQHEARSRGRGNVLAALQRAATVLLGAQVLVAALAILLPALLLAIHEVDGIESLPARLAALGAVELGSVSLGALLARALRWGAKSPLRARLLRALVGFGTALLGPLVLGVPFVAVTYFVTARGPGSGAVQMLALISVVLLVLYWFVLDETTSSTHLFYRERLATAFVGRRVATREKDGRDRFRWDEPPWEEPILFSRLRLGREAAGLPNLVVCAAVNVSDAVVPPGRLAASFTFERDFSGGPLTGYVPTSVLEDASGGGVLTLPALMAVSGAAVAPSMGKMTRPWARILLSLFNARLGLWLPNPLRVADFVPLESDAREPLGARRVRLARGAGGRRPPADPRTTGEDRRGVAGAARHRILRPGTWYVFREALGVNRLRHRYVYVTDGGHWENLGLVELLRRGCGRILCFDAAGDDTERFHTFSEAIALARSELGVEIDIDLGPLVPKDGISEKAHAAGAITYPDGTKGLLVLAKAAIAADAPQDAKDYRTRDPRFPAHGTVDQWFDDRQFESYRALGAHAARGAVEALRKWDEVGELGPGILTPRKEEVASAARALESPPARSEASPPSPPR